MAARISPHEAKTILDLAGKDLSLQAIADQIGRSRGAVRSVIERGGPPAGWAGQDGQPTGRNWWVTPIVPNGTTGLCPGCGRRMRLCPEGRCAICLLLDGLEKRGEECVS